MTTAARGTQTGGYNGYTANSETLSTENQMLVDHARKVVADASETKP